MVKVFFSLTFEAYFEGKKELFEGLAIEKLETKWEKHPVLHLDLNAEKYDSPERLYDILSRQLTLWEIQYGKGIDENTLSGRFSGVIRRAYEQTGSSVVVLVDEYDKPLLQALGNDVLLDEYRKTLKAFYGVLKSADRYLRFVFLTGVTKFSQVSVFSDLNQLQDITLWPDYGTLCGITLQELLDTFQPEIKILAANNSISYDDAVQRMTRLYDGYHFCINSVGIFNPFSVLKCPEIKSVTTITGSRPAHRLSSSRCCKKPNTTCVLCLTGSKHRLPCSPNIV